MRKRCTTVAVLASTALAAVLVVSVAPVAASSFGRATIPTTKLATDNDIALDGLIAIGLKPGCATGPFIPPLSSYASGITSLGEPGVAGTDFNVEALANCAPTGIVAPSYDDLGAGSYYATAATAEKGIAPTIFFKEPNPPVNDAGQVQSTWKDWLHSFADQLGRRQQANEVIAILDLRAGAIRGQVAGKTVGLIDLDSASTFDSADNYLPLATIYVEDLHIKNFLLPASDWSSGCLRLPPEACYSNALSTEELPLFNHVNAILLQSYPQTSSATQTFEENPLFTAIPAVAQGHVAEVTSFTDVGPIGVAFEYSAIEKAFGLKDYHATVSGGTGATASFTLSPSNHRVCWAIDPTPGKGTPVGAITLLDRANKSLDTTLTKRPYYAEPETTYQTTPRFTYQTTGCSVVSGSLQNQLTTAPWKLYLNFSGSSGSLKSGAFSPIVK